MYSKIRDLGAFGCPPHDKTDRFGKNEQDKRAVGEVAPFVHLVFV